MFHSPFDQPSYKPKAKKKAKARKKAPAKKKVAKKVKKKVAKKATKRVTKKKAAKKKATKKAKGSGTPCTARGCTWTVYGPATKCAHHEKKTKKVAKKKATRSRTPNPFKMNHPTAAKNKKIDAAIDRAIGHVAWSEVSGSAPPMGFMQSLYYTHVDPYLAEIFETDTETANAAFTELASRAVKAVAKSKKKVVAKKRAKKTTGRRPPSSSLGGVRVHCVREGGKIRVRPVPGQGYPSTKNIQFPRDKRFEGCQYIVDALDDKGTHFRAVGEIRPF